MAKKWDCDTTSSGKLLLLFATLLFNKRSFSLSELSSPSCLNASKPTTLRLLRQIEHSGLGILRHEKNGRESCYWLDHGRAPKLLPSDSSLGQLAMCRDLVFHLLPEKARAETASTLASLGARAKAKGTLGATALIKGQIDYTRHQGIFAVLEEAILKRLACKITYRATASASPREHTFAPQRLLASHEALYIEGWLLENKEPARRKYSDPLRLALQRFQSCELTKISTAALPQLPDIRNDSLGLMEYEPFLARVWFSGNAAGYIAERIWSKDQNLEKLEDGSVILTVRMANYQEALSWVLGFGKNAVVREPAWFARDVRRELREAARNYRIKRAELAQDDNGKPDERQN